MDLMKPMSVMGRSGFARFEALAGWYLSAAQETQSKAWKPKVESPERMHYETAQTVQVPSPSESRIERSFRTMVKGLGSGLPLSPELFQRTGARCQGGELQVSSRFLLDCPVFCCSTSPTKHRTGQRKAFSEGGEEVK